MNLEAVPKVCEKANQTNPIASIPTNEILLLNTFELKNKDLIKGVAFFKQKQLQKGGVAKL